jgi:hypothetical protein
VVDPVPRSTTTWSELDGQVLRRTVRDADSQDTDPGFPADWLGVDCPPPPSPSSWTASVGWKIEYNPARVIPASLLDLLAATVNGLDRDVTEGQ